MTKEEVMAEIMENENYYPDLRNIVSEHLDRDGNLGDWQDFFAERDGELDEGG